MRRSQKLTAARSVCPETGSEANPHTRQAHRQVTNGTVTDQQVYAIPALAQSKHLWGQTLDEKVCLLTQANACSKREVLAEVVAASGQSPNGSPTMTQPRLQSSKLEEALQAHLRLRDEEEALTHEVKKAFQLLKGQGHDRPPSSWTAWRGEVQLPAWVGTEQQACAPLQHQLNSLAREVDAMCSRLQLQGQEENALTRENRRLKQKLMAHLGMPKAPSNACGGGTCAWAQDCVDVDVHMQLQHQVDSLKQKMEATCYQLEAQSQQEHALAHENYRLKQELLAKLKKPAAVSMDRMDFEALN